MAADALSAPPKEGFAEDVRVPFDSLY